MAMCGLVGLLLVSPTVAAQDADKVQIGRSLYRVYCANCHGETARGDGPMTAFLKVSPTDLTRLEVDGVFPYDDVLRYIDGRKAARAHGRPDMPVWGDAFVQAAGGAGEAALAKTEAVAHFLWSIQEGG
jgi:mono/diheme cytochrome c family protein